MFNKMKMRRQLSNLENHGWTLSRTATGLDKSTAVNLNRDNDTITLHYSASGKLLQADGSHHRLYGSITQLFPYTEEELQALETSMNSKQG